MRIRDLDNGKKNNGVKVNALMGSAEFRQLLGHLDGLCVFATQTIEEAATAIKTGAKHNYAKYFLFPSRIRKRYKAEEFDFQSLKCGTVEYKDKLFVVYGVERKMSAKSVTETEG